MTAWPADARSLDDERPVHVGMDAAVVGVAPRLAQRDRVRLTLGKISGVEAVSIVRSGSVRGAVFVAHGHTGARLGRDAPRRKLELLMFTALPATAVWVDEPLDFAEPYGLLPPPQPTSTRAREAMTANELIDRWGFMPPFLSSSDLLRVPMSPRTSDWREPARVSSAAFAIRARYPATTRDD